MRHAAWPLVAGLAIAGFAAAASCLINDPNHCANKGGNDYCSAEQGMAFCSSCVQSTQNAGCVEELSDPKCEVAEGGGGADTVGTGDDATGEPTAGDDGGMTTGPVDCTMNGMPDAACPAEAPYCIDGTCAGCDAGGEEFCVGIDAALPVCGASGSCVQCTDENAGACGEGEFCSPLGVCGGCTSHDQCAPENCEGLGGDCQACNLDSGACLDGPVFWVNRDGCSEGMESGEYTEPYCGIALAMANVANYKVPVTLRIVPSATPYEGPVSLNATGSNFVAVVGHGGRPTITGTTFAGNVSNLSNRLILSSLVLDTGTQSTVRCASGRLWLDDVIVRGGPIGIEGDNCGLLSVSRTVVTGADEVGIALSGTPGSTGFRMVNSAVVNNGAETATSGGISISGVEDWTIDYSTVIDNLRDSAGSGITCASDSPGAARNSIFLSGIGTAAVDCNNATFHNTVSDTMGLTGDGNVMEVYSPADFDNPGIGDAHLKADADPAVFRIGVWRTGDPPTDVDGDPRPLVDGAPDWAGFDTLPR